MRDRTRQHQTLDQSVLARALGVARHLGALVKAHRLYQHIGHPPVRQHGRPEFAVVGRERLVLETGLLEPRISPDIVEQARERIRIKGG